MDLGQLSNMIATLREMFDEHPDGMMIDADLSRMLGAGLRDMHCASLKLEQYLLEHVETLGSMAPPKPADNVVHFPKRLPPFPLTGGAA